MQWLWKGMVPKRMLSMLLGQTGVGKSQCAIAITAAVTTGAPFPGTVTTREPGKVILITGEDTLEEVVVPRLIVAGADMSRVAFPKYHIDVKKDSKGNIIYGPDGKPRRAQYKFNLSNAVRALTKIIRDHPDTSVIVIDPLNAFLGGKVDAHRNAEVRECFKGIQALAEMHDVAVILVHHMKKGEVLTSITDMAGAATPRPSCAARSSVSGPRPSPTTRLSKTKQSAGSSSSWRRPTWAWLALPSPTRSGRVDADRQRDSRRWSTSSDEKPETSLLQALQKTKDNGQTRAAKDEEAKQPLEDARRPTRSCWSNCTTTPRVPRQEDEGVGRGSRDQPGALYRARDDWRSSAEVTGGKGVGRRPEVVAVSDGAHADPAVGAGVHGDGRGRAGGGAGASWDRPGEAGGAQGSAEGA